MTLSRVEEVFFYFKPKKKSFAKLEFPFFFSTDFISEKFFPFVNDRNSRVESNEGENVLRPRSDWNVFVCSY